MRIVYTVLLAVTASASPALSAGGDVRSWDVVKRDGDWELRKGTDGFEDTARCVVLNSASSEVQVSKARLFVGIDGGLESYRLRFDDMPPTDTIQANKIEERIDSAIIEGKRFESVQDATRLRIQASTRFRSSFQGDYDLKGLKTVMAEWGANGCPTDS